MSPEAPRRGGARSGPGEPVRPRPGVIPEVSDEAPLQAGGEPGGVPTGTANPVETEALRSELAERNDQFLRLAADFENFRRRKAQETADRARYASEEAALALLPVLDNLRRAVEHLPSQEADAQLQSGLRMVVLQFETALAQIGVERVATVGEPFDPAVHQAIGGEESDDVTEDTVVDEVQAGYRLHDRLLRPALVRIAHPRPAPGGAAPHPAL